MSGSALALADANHVQLLSVQTGGPQPLSTVITNAVTTALAVADPHTEGSNLGCVDALISSMPSGIDATTLFGACPSGTVPTNHTFAKPFGVLTASGLPTSVAVPTNLGIAGGNGTTFVDETGNTQVSSPLTSRLIQGLSGGPAVTCSNNTETGWWVFLDGVTLSYASACDAGTTTDFLTPASVQLGATTRLTARDEGGVVVVAPNASQVAGFSISSTLTVGTAAVLALTAPSFTPSDVQIGQWGSGTTITRVVMLDGFTGQAYFSDLSTALGGSATWTQVVLPVGPQGRVFAAPMYPNMLFEVDQTGTPSIVWLPN